MTLRSSVVLLAAVSAAAGCATKSDMAELRNTVTGEFEAERSQREALIAEIQELRAVLLDSLNVQQRRDITGRVDLQRQIQDLNTNLAQLIELTGQTQRNLALMSVAPTDTTGPGGTPGVQQSPAQAGVPSGAESTGVPGLATAFFLSFFIGYHPVSRREPTAFYGSNRRLRACVNSKAPSV